MKLRSTLSVIPLRATDSDRSEMVSQVLYGEQFEVLESREKWMRVVTEIDRYEGWLAKEHRFEEALLNSSIICSSGTLTHHDGSVCLISPGSRLDEEEVGRFTEDVKTLPQSPMEMAERFLNCPYLWGGRSRWGIDCSGLMQIAFLCAGIALPRDAYQQAQHGIEVAYDELEAGDLAFFHNANDRITHVGIILEASAILHASGFVRIDTLCQEGILRRSDKTLSHERPTYRRIST